MAALIFEKPSLRTRVTFEVGFEQMGGHAVYLAPGDIGLGKRESVKDVARNLSRWVDVLIVRTFSQKLLEELAFAASVPIINALTDLLHPCQAIADLMTLQEARGKLKGLHLVYVGDGNNVALSLGTCSRKSGNALHDRLPAGLRTECGHSDRGARGRSQHRSGNRSGARSQGSVEYRGCRVHGCLDEHGSGKRKRRAAARVCRIPGEPSADGTGAGGCGVLALSCRRIAAKKSRTKCSMDRRSVALEQAENRLHAHKAILLAVLAGQEAKKAKAQP